MVRPPSDQRRQNVIVVEWWWGSNEEICDWPRPPDLVTSDDTPKKWRVNVPGKDLPDPTYKVVPKNGPTTK